MKLLTLFLFSLCIMTRASLSVITYKYSSEIAQRTIAYGMLAVMTGFWIAMINKRVVGTETLGGPIWWSALRPPHIILWSLALYSIVHSDSKGAGVMLMLDTVLGLIAFIIHHASVEPA